VRSDGRVLTSKHLISEGFSYIVTLSDGTKMLAKLIKTHPSLDLALLSIVSQESPTFTAGRFINSQASIRQ
jgi:S1-C subfamily serine protease